MKYRTIPLALVLSLFCAAATFAQVPATSPAPASAGGQRKVDETKSVSTPRTKKRVRRPAKPQTKTASQPAATTEPAPAPTTSPVPEAPAEVPAPNAAPDSAPAESPAEETPEPEKVVAPPTAEARVREQLKVVEQMVAQGLKQEALAELNSLAAEDRFDPQGFFNIGNAFARLDATDAAVSTYRKAIAQRKGHYSRALNNMGVVLMRQGFWDQAYEALLSALRIENFRYAEASYNLGRLYASRGELDRASREWKRAVAIDPNHAAAARALNDSRSVSNASPAPASAPVPASVSEPGPARNGTSAPTKAESKAVKTSAQPYTLNPDSYTLLQQGRTAHERGRYEEAVTNFRKVISRMGGYFPPANLELSYSLIELRRTDEAIAELLRVAEKDGSRFPISYYHLGRLYEMRGDLKLAEENFLRATQAYQSENPQFLLNLSTVREKRGDFNGALVAMENYIKRKEQQGQKPDWSDARLASLREKAATQTSKQ